MRSALAVIGKVTYCSWLPLPILWIRSCNRFDKVLENVKTNECKYVYYTCCITDTFVPSNTLPVDEGCGSCTRTANRVSIALASVHRRLSSYTTI